MPATQEHIAQIYIKINGTQVTADTMRQIKEVVVDTSMYLPDMFSIQIEDPSLTWMDSDTLKIGNSVEVSAKSSRSDSSTVKLTKGEIVAIEPEFDQKYGTTVTIRGYDKSHRLHRGKKNAVFLDVKDSDVVQRIAGTCGLIVECDATSIVYKHIFQEYQTDMEFIQDRAQRNGYQAYFEDGKLFFKSASSSTDSGQALEWGQNLTRFQARFSGAGQFDKSEVHGWDVTKKEAVVGTKTTPVGTPTVSSESNGGNLAKQAFGGAAASYKSLSVDTQTEAEALAQSNLNENCQNFFQAEGSCRGNPSVRAGKKVQLKGLGTRFSGNYTVTRAIHRYNFSEYTTDFEISGHRANTLPQLLSGQNSRDAYGVVVGLVTNNKDPDGLARVKVKYPGIDNTLESFWARVTTPMAGPSMGIQFIPEVNDEVLLAFEQNDFNKPYVIGSLWNGKDKPPEDDNSIVDAGKVKKRVIKSRSGHIITLDDSDGQEKITIVDKAGQTITIDSKSGSEKIELVDKGNNKITLDGNSKKVSIESAQDMSIKATGKLQIEAATGIDVKTNSNLKMEGTAGVSIKGATASIEGQGSAELKSSGMLTVKGSLVKIN